MRARAKAMPRLEMSLMTFMENLKSKKEPHAKAQRAQRKNQR
jgi:hypothetical protein